MRLASVLLFGLPPVLGAGGFYWLRQDSGETEAASATTMVTHSDVDQSMLASGVVEASQPVSVGVRASG